MSANEGATNINLIITQCARHQNSQFLHSNVRDWCLGRSSTSCHSTCSWSSREPADCWSTLSEPAVIYTCVYCLFIMAAISVLLHTTNITMQAHINDNIMRWRYSLHKQWRYWPKVADNQYPSDASPLSKNGIKQSQTCSNPLPNRTHTLWCNIAKIQTFPWSMGCSFTAITSPGFILLWLRRNTIQMLCDCTLYVYVCNVTDIDVRTSMSATASLKWECQFKSLILYYIACIVKCRVFMYTYKLEVHSCCSTYVRVCTDSNR